MRVMIPTDEAEQLIQSAVRPAPTERKPLQEALGRVLREDIVADRDLPPFDRVAMDGIALRHAAWRAGQRSFMIEGMQRAGEPRRRLRTDHGCLEVMTGAVLPEGCDCVVPVENIQVTGNEASLREGFRLQVWQNVHRKGSDAVQGAVLLARGRRIRSAQTAVAASAGYHEVLVDRPPSVAVVATGDELVPIDQTPEAFQIRSSNSHAIEAALRWRGYAEVRRFHIPDDLDLLKERLGTILKEFDVLILTGGVSMGKKDHVPEVLGELRVEVLFHKVRQRPGKPFWFGKSPWGGPVFALPGNPVAAQISAHRYVLPYLDQAAGDRETKPRFIQLSRKVTIRTAFTYFLPVRLTGDPSEALRAEPVFTGGSGDYAALAETDGFVEIPPDTFEVHQDRILPFYAW